MTEIKAPQPAPRHTPGPWLMTPANKWTSESGAFVQWGQFNISANSDDPMAGDDDQDAADLFAENEAAGLNKDATEVPPARRRGSTNRPSLKVVEPA